MERSNKKKRSYLNLLIIINYFETEMKKYPYQNLILKNIKGERWKDIPGLEMYFKVSTYGRVKRLEYELTYSDGRIYVKPEKIIKPVVM